ncbi:RNA helicase like protein [Babesia gibsoni]|uniref:ATP-dependent RNA helicase n=1 Tax=Babesia gibsoni TaxID=33632 RepID=A0AAD8LPV2_BABGI|nr:RNA helicase like protein [Babesia gibsoni]
MLPNSLLVHQVHCVMSNVFRGTGITVEMVDNIETQEMPSVVIGTPLKVLNKFKVYNMNFKVNVFENVRYLVLDEADQLVEETEEASMREFLKLTRKRVKTVLSAATVSTAGKLSTAKTIERLFKRIQVVKTDKVHSLPSHIDTEFVYCADYEQKVQTVLDVLQQVEPGKRALIFCGSVESSAKLADLLKQMNPRLDVGVVNRNVELPQQLAVLDIDRGNRFIVCTDSLARGLDLGDVSLTIQFDFPTSVLHYIHRTGRSGRNMQLSKTVLLWTDDNREFYHLLYEHRNNLELLFSRKRGLRKKIKRGIAISPIEHKDESSTSQGTDNTFEQHTT